jgi:2-methylcitrate dehydratase PrpD
MMTITKTSMSEELARVRQRDVPDEVLQKAKSLLLDSAGVMLAALSQASSHAMAAAMKDLGGSPESTIFGLGDRVSAPNAALANGSMLHTLDFDDTHLPSQVHVSSSVVPAALAAAEQRGSTGRELLHAVAYGAEVSIRVGMAAPGYFNDNGFHATPVCGTFGAAAAVGSIFNLTPEQQVNAFGLATSQAAGLLAFLDAPQTWVKRFHPGWAAHSGYLAAHLASFDYTGPPAAFESRFGLYRTHVNGNFAPTFGTDANDEWEMLRIGLKPYPTGHFNIPFMDAAAALVEQHGIELEAIETIDCRITERALETVCLPIEEKRRPPTGYAAKFSLPFSVASRLVHGRSTLAEFSDESITDVRTLALADKVICTPDPDADFPRYYPAWVVITLADGRSFEGREPIHRGHPDNPMSEQQLAEKFRGCTSAVLSDAEIGHVVKTVQNLEQSADLSALIESTTVGGRARMNGADAGGRQ